MKLKSSVGFSESGSVFDASMGNTFNVNETGLFILECLKNGISMEEIVKKTEIEYEVTTSQAEKDVYDFLNLARQFKLLVAEE